MGAAYICVPSLFVVVVVFSNNCACGTFQSFPFVYIVFRRVRCTAIVQHALVAAERM